MRDDLEPDGCRVDGAIGRDDATGGRKRDDRDPDQERAVAERGQGPGTDGAQVVRPDVDAAQSQRVRDHRHR